MFKFLKKKKLETIYSPIEGVVVESKEVNDPTFAEEMLGKGLAIKPTVGKAYAPFDGTVEMIFPTKHALGLKSKNGVEVLMHIGLDTVKLEGKPFTVHVNAGDSISKGDLLVEFDMDMIKAEGLETITPVVVTNSFDYKEVTRLTGKTVKVGEVVMEIE